MKYVNIHDANFLINILSTEYPITVDWKGSHYCGLTLSCNYSSPRNIYISMPEYIPHTLAKYNHKQHKTTHTPYLFTLNFNPKLAQLPTPTDTSPPLPSHLKTHVKQVLRSLLYYARCVDPTILVALGTISSQQQHPTTNTLTRITHLLDYMAPHPKATQTFYT